MSSPNSRASSQSRSYYPLSAKQRTLILVVERNPVVQQRLERLFLEQSGFTVELASDGVATLERAREFKPNILVTEILVPKLDGLSLCPALKSGR